MLILFGGTKDSAQWYATHHGMKMDVNVMWAGEPEKMIHIHESCQGIVIGDEDWGPHRMKFIYARRIFAKILRFYPSSSSPWIPPYI